MGKGGAAENKELAFNIFSFEGIANSDTSNQAARAGNA